MSRPRSSRAPAAPQEATPLLSRPLVLCGLLFAIAFAAYFNTFSLNLATDAYGIVHTDTRVQNLNFNNLGLIFSHDYWWPTPADSLYRPVTLLSYLINYDVLGDGVRPTGYHVVNFVLHGINCCLLFFLARRVLGDRTVAFFAAALFAVHPIGTESVANVSGRTDLLSALGLFAAMLLHAVSADWPAPRRYTAAAGIFLLGLFAGLAKENGLILPGLLFLWDSLDLPKLRARLAERAPAYAASLAAIGVIYLLRQHAFAVRAWPRPPYLENPLITTDFWTARLTAIKALGIGLWRLLFPVTLSSDHSYAQISLSTWSDPAFWISLVAICALLFAALTRYRKDKIPYFAAGLAGIALLPSANLLVLIGTVLAERTFYLPAAALGILLAAIAFRTWNARQAQLALAAVLLCYTGRTLIRNMDWKDNLTLEAADVGASPGSFRLHDLLGRGLFVQDAATNIDRCIHEGEEGWKIVRDLPPEWLPEQTPYHLGLYYANKADMAGGAKTQAGREWQGKAIEVLTRAVQIGAASEAAFDRLQAEHGRPRPARSASPQTFKTLGLVYERAGRHKESLDAFRSGRAISPDAIDWYLPIAREYLSLGQRDWAAITMLQDAELEGLSTDAVNGLAEALQTVSEGACAVMTAGKTKYINYKCPWVATNVCTALEDLAQAYAQARRPSRASELRAKAASQYGCKAPAAP